MPKANIKDKLSEISGLVMPVIEKLLTQNVEKNNAELIIYQCKVGGKRIRPALVILSGQIFGAKINDLLYPAASIEILHNATLIVDDIIDHSQFRRDKPTAWSKYGKSIAQCAIFDYLAAVYEGINHANNSSKLIDLYSKTLKIIIDGEIKDILFERSGRNDEDYVVKNRYPVITKDDYFKMIGQKTAVLLQTCCKAGAIVAGASDEQINIIGDFGFNLGNAFQIYDDILDIFGNEKEFGKKIGKDIIEKKMGNYVLLSAIEKLEQKDVKFINDLLSNVKVIKDEDVTKVTELINKTDAKKTAEISANSYVQDALNALKKLPQNDYSENLTELAEYVIARNY